MRTRACGLYPVGAGLRTHACGLYSVGAMCTQKAPLMCACPSQSLTPPHTLASTLHPAGAGFLSMLRGFRAQLPGITPITLTASVLFYVPGVRDLSCWLGFRQVGALDCCRLEPWQAGPLISYAGLALGWKAHQHILFAYRLGRLARCFLELLGTACACDY